MELVGCDEEFAWLKVSSISYDFKSWVATLSSLSIVALVAVIATLSSFRILSAIRSNFFIFMLASYAFKTLYSSEATGGVAFSLLLVFASWWNFCKQLRMERGA